MNIPRQRHAVQPERHLTSPLGDTRERPVPCLCGVLTFNVCGSCDGHCHHAAPAPDPATARTDIPAPAGESR